MHVILPFELLPCSIVSCGLDLSVKATKPTAVPVMLQTCIVEVLGSIFCCNMRHLDISCDFLHYIQPTNITFQILHITTNNTVIDL
jgi:hypothetical protein